MRLIFLAVVSFLLFQINHAINVGVGISDITGPAAEIPMVSLVWNVKNDLITEDALAWIFSSKNIFAISDGFCKE